MPVPASINDLSTTASSNSPTGGETPKDGDNYLRALSAFVAELRDKLNGTAATGTINDATFSGTMAGAATWAALQTFAAGLTAPTSAAGNVYSATYTPTLTAINNVDSSTAYTMTYSRNGDMVTVAGALGINPTNPDATTVLDISLPVASNFSSGVEIGGTATRYGGSVPFLAATIGTDVSTDRAQLSFYNDSRTGSDTWTVHFSYRVL